MALLICDFLSLVMELPIVLSYMALGMVHSLKLRVLWIYCLTLYRYLLINTTV